MMDRRRALLMGAAKKLTIADLDIGTGVMFGSSAFIIVDKAETHVSILREALLGARKMYDDPAPSTFDYDGSLVDTYLRTTYYNGFSSSLKNLFVEINISYAIRTSSGGATKTIARKVCVPNEAEVSSATWLNALKTYYGVSTQNTARAKDKAWWLRDAYTGANGYFRLVKADGTINNMSYKNVNTCVRPVIFVSPTAEVYLNNGIYTVKS